MPVKEEANTLTALPIDKLIILLQLLAYNPLIY